MQKGSENMNKIFKVIWSKTRNCYVVASELAKGRTKAASTGDKAKRLALAAITALMLLPVGGYSYAADTDTATVTDTSSTQQTVYTQDGANNTFVKKGSDNGQSLTIGASESEILSTHQYVTGAQTTYDGLNGQVVTQATGGKSSISLKVGNSEDLTYNFTNYSEVTTTKDGGTTFTYHYEGGAQPIDNKTTIKGNTVTTGRVTASNGVVDETTTEGVSVKTTNTVGQNLSALDTRITNVKEYLEKQTSDTYVSKDDAAVQDGAIVKADKTIGENVTNLDAALAKETAARIGADKAQDAVIQQVNQNAANGIATLATAYNNEVASREAADNELNERITNEANAIHETTNQLQSHLSEEAKTRESKDNELNERITNEANTIHDEIKAGDEKLDTRITNVKEYLEKQTSDTYVSKDDAAVQDGAIVKADKTIGENVTNLDAALAKETAARLGADKAQDKVIETVNQNMVDGFNTINKNMSDGFTALSQADANELAGRMAADTKLVEAVNSGLSLSNDNVLQKNTTTIDAQGNVTTSKTDANEIILNKVKDNQITLNEKGIKVGTNSSVMDKDGVYTGGDTFDAAKAAMKSDGQIKGANGKFTVAASGNTSVTSLDAGTGTIQTKGDLYAKDATFSGDITAKDATLSGDFSAKDGTFSGDLSAKDGTFSGDVSAKDVTATGTLQGAEVTDGTATLKQGKLTGVKDIETEALHVNGDANVTGKLTTKDLEVTGEFNANTLKSRLDENNYTEIHGGNVTSKNLKVDKGVTRTSESSFDENGREEYVTDNDSRATVKVGANEISQTLDDKGDTSEKQSTFRQKIDQILQEIKSANGSTSVEQTDVNITNTAKNGTITNDAQNLVNKASDSITSQIGDGSAVKSVMDANGIANTATGGTISNSAADVINTGTNSVINQVGDNQVAVKTDSVKAAYGSDTSTTWDAKGITNTTSGDISNSAANISNTTTGNMTNTVGGNLIDTIMGTSTTTVTGKVTEDYKSDLSTKVGGDETHYVAGSQTNTVSGDRTVSVKGTERENFNAQVTNVKTDQKTSVGGNQTNIVGGDQQNTVSGSKTETVKGSVTEKYGSQATTVDGDQSTNIGGNQTTVVAKDQTNTVSGNKTETVKGAVNETYGSQTTKVNGDQSTTVTGKQTNSITGDQVNTIGGNQTTTVTGNVTEDYKVDLSTKVGGNETHAVTGNQTVTVSKDRTVNVKGTETENFNAQVTNVKTDQRTSVGGNQTNIVVGNQQNTVSGSKTETVKGSVTEKYGSQATTVDGDQSTHVGGNQSNVVAGDQTNTISGSKTETVKGAVSETYGSQTTKVNGNQSTTVTGKQTNSITGDQVNTIGGSQTTTVTGDSSLSAKNITNTATEKLSNSATDIENKASTSILNQVGDNTSWKMTDGKVVESIKGADGQTNTTTTTAGDTYQSVQNGNNVLAKRTSSTNDNLNITDGTNTYSKITTATSNKQTVTDGTETASTNLTKSASNTYITNGTQTVSNHIAADTTNTVMNEGSNGSRQEQTASQILDRVTDGTNTNSTTTTASGTTFENTAHNTALPEMTKHESGDFTKTTISGNTIETGQATMDYAEVMKDLGVHGNATVDGNTSVGGNLSVTGTSTLTGDVTMKSNATVEKNLTVKDTTTTDKLVVNNGATIKGGTTTDTLHVTSTSTFDGKATFKDIVTMEKDLSVGGNATVAGSMTASSYKVGDKTYIDSNGINANDQKVVNVAPGRIAADSKDAVNGSQLYQTNERVTSVENRVGTVENRVDKLDSRVDKVGANAAALANLHPLEFDADSKWNIAAAVGGYKGETATAIGAFYRPNENVMVNVSSSFGTGENMYGGGISLRIGQGGNKARRNATNGLTEREKAMQKQIDSLTSRLDALLSVINPNMSKDFPDVPENHWAYEAVSRLAGNGVIQGYEDGKYHGDRTMTRYEMAEIIYNALSKGAKAEKKLVEEFKPELQAMAAQKKA